MTTQEQYLEEAATHEQRKTDSIERSDTDGFLSQWASGLMADKARANAEIAANGGTAEFAVLVEMETGRVLDAKKVSGKYGPVWCLEDHEADTIGRKWIPTDASHVPDLKGRSRVQKQLGVIQETRPFPAIAVLSGSGTGLSGQAWVQVIKRTY